MSNQAFLRGSKKVEDLNASLGPPLGCPLEPVKKIMKNKMCKFSLQTVHPDSVRKIIRSLKNTLSCGLDTIDSKTVKLAENELTPAITHIINLSIKYKQFPTSWKKAKIIPIHKKNEVHLPKNYRPVSLLSTISKV